MLFRGHYPIPWGCQFKPYDPYEKVILAAAGKMIHGHRGRKEDKPAFGYDFFLFNPNDPGLSWTAFGTRPDLQQFLDAYGLSMESEPGEGEAFRVRVPEAPVLAPLRHVATEQVSDDTGLSFRVAKLGDEPYDPRFGQKRSRRMMHLELWDSDRQVAEFGPFTVGAPPSIHADPDEMAPDEIEMGLAVLIGSMSWESRWSPERFGGNTELVDRVIAMARQVRADDAPAPRMKG